MENTVPKVFLLAAASWMEKRVLDVVLTFFREISGDFVQGVEFVRIEAMERKYHTWFDWKKRAPGHFFAKFGPDMKRVGVRKYKEDPDFADAYDAFLELGDLRNQLVHQNYATFTLEKTTDEVRRLFLLAEMFVDQLPELLREDVRLNS